MGPFKVQETPVALNVTEYEKFIGISDSMLPLIHKETLLSFGVVWKKNIGTIWILSEKAITIFLPFPTTYLWQLIKYEVYENPDIFYQGHLKKM